MDRLNFASVAGFVDTVVNNTEVLESVLMLAPTTLEMSDHWKSDLRNRNRVKLTSKCIQRHSG